MDLILLYLVYSTYEENKKRTEIEERRYQDELARWENAVNAETMKMVNEFRDSLSPEEKEKLAKIQERIDEAHRESRALWNAAFIQLLMAVAMAMLIGIGSMVLESRDSDGGRSYPFPLLKILSK